MISPVSAAPARLMDALRTRYSATLLRFDLTAALTTAIVALPQSMAYALIAGVEPVYGLYTAIVSAIIGSLFGSSSHLITGPTNALSLMIAAALKDYSGGPDFYATLFVLTASVGLIQLALGALRVGKIIHFVSHSVIVGFTAGAGIIIGLGQLNECLGIALPKSYLPLYRKVLLTFASLDAANLTALALAAGTMAVIALARRINRNIPGALIGLVACAVVTAGRDLGGQGVRLVGDIPAHLPAFQLPAFTLGQVADLFPGAFALAVVGLVEAMAIGKSISLSSGQRINPSREFMGQGLANLIGACFSCFPASGSFTRSAINYGAQAKTRVAGVCSGVLVAAILIFFASWAQYIPKASLAGVIVMTAWGMVDKTAMRKIARASRFDLTVMAITVAATVIMPDLERAILSGITVSVIVHLWNTGEIKIRVLRRTGLGGYTELPPGKDLAVRLGSDTPMLHIEGDLYFGSADDLRDKLEQVTEALPSRVYILRLKRVNVVDLSAMEILEHFIRRSAEQGRKILLCGVSLPMKRFFDRTGITALAGEDCIFPAEENLHASSNRAYDRAQEILHRWASDSSAPKPA